MQYIAFADLQLKAVDSAMADVALTDATATVTLEEDANSSVDDAALVTKITIKVLAVKTTAITNGDGKSTQDGVIEGNARYCTANDKPVLLADSDYLTGNPAQCTIALQGTSGSSTVSDVLTVWVADAGQTVVQGE